MDKLKHRLKSDPKADLPFEPLPGHRERFESKLLAGEQQNRFFNRHNPLWLWGMAAGLLFMIGLFLWNWNQELENQVPLKLADVSYELGATEEFFKTAMKAYPSIPESDDPVIQKQLLNLKRLENEHQRLEQELNYTAANERVISALIENYKLRLKVLENIRQYLRMKQERTTANPSNNG